jgi:DNA-binding PadR family transcriptional regulator
MSSFNEHDPFAERRSRFGAARDNTGGREHTHRKSYSAYLPLPPLTFHVLLSLVEGPCHGYELQNALWGNGYRGILPHYSSVYRRLHRLQEQGWVVRLKDYEEPPSAGPMRRTYRLTDDGLGVLEAEMDRLDRVLRLAAQKLARRVLAMRQGGRSVSGRDDAERGTVSGDVPLDPFGFDVV